MLRLYPIFYGMIERDRLLRKELAARDVENRSDLGNNSLIIGRDYFSV